MAATVGEIMNPELFMLRATTRKDEALDALLDMRITAAPVVDDDLRPLGLVTLRDLLRRGSEPAMSMPALSVRATVAVEDAAHVMVDSGRHHLVVVGSDGRVVGLLSSYDLVRALVAARRS